MDAESGIANPEEGAAEKVCEPEPVLVTMKISRPLPEDVANVCEATEEPFYDVIVPPAPPASVPQ